MNVQPRAALHLLLASAFLCSNVSAEDSAAARTLRFNRDVRPILAEFCLHCHGPDDQHREADLRLDLAEHAVDIAIIPGTPEKSSLIERIESSDPDSRMPPPESKKELSADQIQTLKRWIRQGAEYEGHWSFQPIRKSKIPNVTSADEVALSPIDRFIRRRLHASALDFAPAVSKTQWIRRVTFDLIGLPPKWEDVQAFVNDSSPEAAGKVVDRLLASPRYGERWGRHWLDLARYADTHGGSAIGFTKFPFSYTYRDYVIEAFNSDLAYDRFVTEQLAADQLGLGDNDPSLAALGFLTVGMQFRNPHDMIDDQIDVTTRGLLGLTVACARCHDHKYDPIPTADYYALYATFASSRKPDLPPVIGRGDDTPGYPRYAEELRGRKTIHEDMRRDQTAVMRGRLRMQVGLYLRELAEGTPEQDLAEAFLSYRTDDLRPLVLNRWRDYLAKMPPDDPVFGPWVVLSKLDANDDVAFTLAARKHVQQWLEENGDRSEVEKQHQLGGQPPKWNPLVLDALSEPLRSMLDVAEAYGRVFAETHRQWLTALLEASLEASPEGELVTDQDARHRIVNSSIQQQLRHHLYHPGTPTVMDDPTSAKVLNRTVRDNLRGKRNAIEKLHLVSPGSPPRAMVLLEEIPERDFHVFRRGNPIDRGEVVQPHFLTAISRQTPPQTFPDGQRRLALARALTDPDNPLLRRVIANWVWQKHFGIGLVRTPDDFGTRSEPPTHPDLLDHLAVTLLQDGWSLKSLHKRILLSRTYAQAAQEDPRCRMIDPENRLLWRLPRRRLSMEAMRDAMLAVSGELDVSGLGGRPFDFLSKPIVPRRSVYGFVNRDIIHSLASTFDAANPTACTVKRDETTVPQQTLFALNSEFIQDRAAAFAALAATKADAAGQIRFLYRKAYGREPEPEELQTAFTFLDDADSKASLRTLAHAILASNEFVFVD